MNYKKCYENLIKTRKLLNRKKGKEVYYENHHIIPRCLGGTNEKDNLVLLTAKEHYIAHLLLLYCYEDGKIKQKLSYALFQMCRRNKQHQRITSTREFEKARKLMSENSKGEYGAFYGKTHSDEFKRYRKEQWTGANNPVYIYGVWNKGMKMPLMSEDEKKKISERVKNFYKTEKGLKQIETNRKKCKENFFRKPKTEEQIKKLSIASKAYWESLTDEEKKKKISNRKSIKGVKQKILVCPTCGKKGGTTMKRWHFDRCPQKIKSTEIVKII